MGRRTDRARTPGWWIAANELPTTGGHPFYQRLHQVLDAHGFDAFVESQCAPFYADGVGRPRLTPGTYFRLLLIGYFEGIDSERGIAWRTADSLALRGFLGLGLDEVPPEHSTISRTRRLIAVETRRAVFAWIVQVLATAQLVKGKTIGIDATTLEANAALRSIVRRDAGETYQAFLTQLAQASGVETPTRAALARLDRKRPKKGRNREWRHPHDPEARITKMKDGRTHLPGRRLAPSRRRWRRCPGRPRARPCGPPGRFRLTETPRARHSEDPRPRSVDGPRRCCHRQLQRSSLESHMARPLRAVPWPSCPHSSTPPRGYRNC